MAGRGTYTFAKGGSLECDFADDRAQGKGVLKLPDGTTYKGAFVDGAMHGRGVLRANGATYKGAFAANMFHGKGKLTFPSGDTYSGAFAKHAFHGKGVYAWRSGKRYEGHFKGGRLTGDGVYTWTEGQKYTGAYVNGRREGRGERAPAPPRRRGAPRRPIPRARARRLAGAYGQHYEGEWEDGEPHGAGVFTSSNSEYVEGDFHRGRYVDPDKEDASPTSGLGSLFGGGSASSKHHLP